ncbi:unnamed protein product [Rotaria magnacalcarata]|uniref:Uncharacterized protein n=1 Tax=Rotaria magnacalcarata TaxID=392030 RepID=A0A816RSN1_9BILA|nr:unnamed protein product [Rotaria magnacalcarata]
MLTDFCISESAVRNRQRRKKGLLKMAHIGKAALNILGWTIHTALGMRPDNTSTRNDAPSFKIHSLKNRLGDLILIIIDEISLVSHSLFQKKIGMARTLFFNPVKASQKESKIILQPSGDENDCGYMFEQLPLCIGARVICRRNIDFDGAMVNETEATIKDIILGQ